jgi:hypothetical protein
MFLNRPHKLISMKAVAALVLVVLAAGCVGQTMSAESIIANPAAAMANCAGAPADQKDNCYMAVSGALHTANVTASYEACTGVSSPQNTQKNPRQDCVQSLINAQNDTGTTLGICRLIDRDDWKKNCIEDLSNSVNDQTKRIEICNEINDSNFRNHCYGPISESSSNISLDTKLQLCAARSDSDNCYRNVAQDLFATAPAMGVNVCNKISDSNIKESCLNSFLGHPELIKANPDLAEGICGSFSALMKGGCYNNVAQALSTTDPQRAAGICKKLGDDTQISNCYGSVWFYSNNLTLENYDFTVGLCNVLTLRRDDCLNRIVGVLIDVDRAKAAATCLLMSPASSPGCLNNVHR